MRPIPDGAARAMSWQVNAHHGASTARIADPGICYRAVPSRKASRVVGQHVHFGPLRIGTGKGHDLDIDTASVTALHESKGASSTGRNSRGESSTQILWHHGERGKSLGNINKCRRKGSLLWAL